MINFILLVSRQGKTRLSKWFTMVSPKDKARAMREITASVLSRGAKLCNFLEWQDKKIVYKRYASLYFIACVDKSDNELITLEKIHLFVEVLDRYFGNVCELDIIFNFHKAYYIVDELFIGGHLQETSKAEVLRVCSAMDDLMEMEMEGGQQTQQHRGGRR
jgi:AP-1 complex subunit sigma 1/2